MCVHGGLSPDIRTIDQVFHAILVLYIHSIVFVIIGYQKCVHCLIWIHHEESLWMWNCHKCSLRLWSGIYYQIRVIERHCEIPHEGPFCDLMWSDPEDIETWAVSPRGAGWLFGARVTSEVCLPVKWFLKCGWFQRLMNFVLQFNHINGLELVCRAHQLVQEGLKYMFPDKGLVTVFMIGHAIILL